MAFCGDLECWQLADGSAKFCKDHAQSSQRLDLSGLANVQLHHTAPPSDEFSKALILTQNAINNLGAPIHASMTDHKPVDLALAQALTQTAIAHQGERHVDSDKIPKDRAIAEALTLTAIAHQPQEKLRETGRRSSMNDGLTAEQQASLLQEAQAEKDRKTAAKTYGGGEAKELMANILGEIQGQGGIISVPHDKVPDENITLNQIKTLAQINALQEGAPNLTHTEQPVDHSIVQARTMKALASGAAAAHLAHKEAPEDHSLAHANLVYSIDHLKEGALKHEDHKLTDASLAHGQTLYAIGHHRASSMPSEKAPVDKAIVEALTLNALGSEAPRAHLKHVGAPEDGLSKEEIAQLQAAAQQEKAGDAPASNTEEVTRIHLPQTENSN
jgi:hypothetical protein